MANSHPEEVIDISSSEGEEDDDDRIVAFAESMNTVPVAAVPVTVVGLQNNPSGQSTFKLSRKSKSRNSKAGSSHEHNFSEVVVTPKITSHFTPSSSARQNLGSSAQKHMKMKPSSSLDPNQPVIGWAAGAQDSNRRQEIAPGFQHREENEVPSARAGSRLDARGGRSKRR